jgi:hypothetical protein
MDAKVGALLAGIAGKVFLGEAYPSGNVYLEAFQPEQSVTSHGRPPLESWPASVTVYCLYAAACTHQQVGKAPREAKRSGYYDVIMKDQDKGTEIEPSMPIFFEKIPLQEGFGAERIKSCKLNHKSNPDFFYADHKYDYFDANLESCVTSEEVVRYRVKKAPKNAAHRIIATTSGVELKDIVYGKKDEKRSPPKPDKTSKVPEKNKQKDKDDCTTVPRSIEDADVLLKAQVKGTGQSLRLSFYSNPGCYGHASEYYILDVMEGKKISGTYFISKDAGIL